MAKLTQAKEKYDFVASHLDALLENGYDVKYRRGVLFVSNDQMSLALDEMALRALDSGTAPESPGLIFQDDFGVSIKEYSEFFIHLGHPAYVFLEAEEWPSETELRFRIGSASISVGLASPILVMLTEPLFLDRDYYPEGFSELSSLKMHGVKPRESRALFHKAMFYLNSHYLRPTGMYASLRKLAIEFDDPLGLVFGEGDFDKIFAKVKRTRVRTRRDLKSREPLILYNYATESNGAESFLAYYRVLEFFTHRNVLALLNVMRLNEKVSSSELLAFCAARNEEQMLIKLLTSVLTSAQKKKLTAFAKNCGLISHSSFESLAKSLYAFRNSLVHAKELEITRTIVPDPFEDKQTVENWIYIARIAAERAIGSLNV